MSTASKTYQIPLLIYMERQVKEIRLPRKNASLSVPRGLFLIFTPVDRLWEKSFGGQCGAGGLAFRVEFQGQL